MAFRLTKNFIFLLMCASLSASYAQDQRQIPEIQESLTARKRFVSNVELLVGSGTVFFRGDEFYKEYRTFKSGFSANVALVHKFNSRVQLRSIIAYEVKGAKLIVNSINSDLYSPPAAQKHIIDITTNYATVALVAKYSFLKSKRLSFGCGPYFSYFLREKVTSKVYINGSLTDMYGGIAYPAVDQVDYKPYDLGLAVMAGVDVRTKLKPKANIQLVYERGMIDINQPMITQLRNNTISILLGITIK